jgi:NADH-quinone oxidoreductase subunit C
MIETLFEPLPVLCLGKCDPARTGLAWSVFLEAGHLRQATEILYRARYCLEDITAIDAEEGYLGVYHFDHMDQPGRVALRVLAAHDAARLPSIADIFQGAEWHERETTDFYGIVFDGNPNPVPLLLMPEMTVHPLQKEPGARAKLADVLAVGEIVRREPGFDLIPPQAAAGSGSTEA